MAPKAKLTDQPVNVRLPRDLHQAMLDRAVAEDRTLAQTIRVALRYYLAKTAPIYWDPEEAAVAAPPGGEG